MGKPLAAIQAAITPERLSTYRAHVGGDLDAAVRLYEWNASASAAFWLDIGHVEVLVRNAMHRQLSVWTISHHGHHRLCDDPGRVLTPHHREDIATARRRLDRAGKQDDPGRIVAELGFGFWRYMLASHYDRTLWKPILSHSFPGQPRRRPLYEKMTRLHRLRNSLAHHEPIHRLPLGQLLGDMMTVMEWLDPDLQSWVASQSNARFMLTSRPSSGPADHAT